MEYIDLHTGFALLGFQDYRELQRVAQLCRDKRKAIAFKGEFSHMQEILARHVAHRDGYGGFMDYRYPLHDFFKVPGSGDGPNREGPLKAKQSISTAIQALEQKVGFEVKFIIVCRK